MASLLQLSSRALGEALACGAGELPDLAALPDPELAVDVWRPWQSALEAAVRHSASGSTAAAAAARRPPSLQRAGEVLRAFAAAFWRPQLLRLAYAATGAVPPGLASLPLVSQQLIHLELAAPGLWSLDALQAACPQLRCLSLRGCTHLGDAALAALQCCSALRALDLGGLAQLSDGAAYHVAKLPHLAALNLSGTAITDRALELLTYGHAARAWQQAAGAAELPPEAACWPAPPLEHLQLEGTRVGAPGLALLERLPQLRFLDCRGTGVTRAALALLERRFGLVLVQGAVLSSSNAAAAAVVNCDAVACRCGLPPDGSGGQAAPELRRWEATGAQLLLHFDPAAGIPGLLEPHRRPLPARAQPGGTGLAAAAAPAGPHQGRRTGYRQPR